VTTVYRLSRMYDDLSERSALVMLAAWRGSILAVARAKYRPSLYDDERSRARPSAQPRTAPQPDSSTVCSRWRPPGPVAAGPGRGGGRSLGSRQQIAATTTPKPCSWCRRRRCGWITTPASPTRSEAGTIPGVPGNRLDFTLLEPLGVTGHIIPWNYPFLLVARSVAPALAMGNTVVIKPAEETSLTALKFAELCERAGIPPGVVNVVCGFGAEAGAALASHPHVAGITVHRFGRDRQAGHEDGRRPCRADQPRAGREEPEHHLPRLPLRRRPRRHHAGASLSHAGQVCIAGGRLFLHRDIHDRFLEALLDRMGSVRIGDAFDSATQMGPLVSADQLERVTSYIDVGQQEGAKLLLGVTSGPPAKASTAATTLSRPSSPAHNSLRIAQEEIFGPVLTVIPWDDEDELLQQANDTIYGLYASIWTQDITKALNLARNLEVGGVVNQRLVRGIPALLRTEVTSTAGSTVKRDSSRSGATPRSSTCAFNLDDRLTGGPGLPADWADAPL